MYPASFKWHQASSFEEATKALLALGPDAKLIAGGQTLIPMMKLRLLKPADLIDISRIASADTVEVADDQLRIGALARHHEIGSAAAAKTYPILKDCALGIADPQVRNLGTIGGAVAEADPSGCWPTLLIALDATATCSGPEGKRLVRIRDLLQDAYSPALAAGELIERISIPLANLTPTSAYVAFKRSAPAYPTASCALAVRFEGETISSFRLGLGCVALVPFALEDLETTVLGKRLTKTLIDEIADHATRAAEPFDDNRGTADYKRSLVGAMVRRAFANVEQRRAGPAVVETHTYYG